MTVNVIIDNKWYSVPEPTGPTASAWDARLSEITEGAFPLASELRHEIELALHRLRLVEPDFEDRLAELLRTYDARVPWARGTPAELQVAFRKIVGYGLAAAGQDDVAWGGRPAGVPA